MFWVLNALDVGVEYGPGRRSRGDDAATLTSVPGERGPAVLSEIVDNLGNLWRRIAVPRRIDA